MLSACIALPLLLAGDLRITFDVHPVAELWYALRAARDEEPGDEELHAEAIRAIAELETAMGSTLAMGRVESLLGQVARAEELIELFGELPERYEARTPRGNRRVELQRLAVDAAAALADYAPLWMEHHWPQREKRLIAARDELRKAFASDGTHPALAHVLRSLGMTTPEADRALPVLLVSDMPWPGAVTYRTPGGGQSFVSLGAVAGSLRLETVLHEVSHQLDEASRDSTVAKLRAALTEAGAGVEPLRNLPHLLLFLAAADATRACFAEDHVDYGKVERVYGRLGPAASFAIERWRAHRAGSLSQAEFVEEVAGRATAGVEKAHR